MAPEILVRPYNATAADIWSCGVILVAMLAGGELIEIIQLIVSLWFFFIITLICACMCEDLRKNTVPSYTYYT